MVKSWNEVTISQYRQIVKIKENDDWVWNFLAILENTTYEDIVTRPLKEITEMSSEVLKWAKKPVKRHLVKTEYDINGTKYVLRANPQEITVSQYIDFVNADKQIPDNLPMLLSVFLVPEGKKYNEGYSIEDVASDLEGNMNIEDAMSVCDFFTALYQLLSGRILRRAKKALILAKKEGIAPKETEILIKEIERYRRLSGLRR